MKGQCHRAVYFAFLHVPWQKGWWLSAGGFLPLKEFLLASDSQLEWCLLSLESSKNVLVLEFWLSQYLWINKNILKMHHTKKLHVYRGEKTFWYTICKKMLRDILGFGKFEGSLWTSLPKKIKMQTPYIPNYLILTPKVNNKVNLNYTSAKL